MQISTIEVRIEGVDPKPPAKKDGKEDAGIESAFAAFFADAQHDVRQKSVAKKTSSEDGDSAERAGSVAHDGAKPLRPAAEDAQEAAPDSEVESTPGGPASQAKAANAEVSDDAMSKVVVVSDGVKRSHVKYTVSKANAQAAIHVAASATAAATKTAANVMTTEGAPTVTLPQSNATVETAAKVPVTAPPQIAFPMNLAEMPVVEAELTVTPPPPKTIAEASTAKVDAATDVAQEGESIDVVPTVEANVSSDDAESDGEQPLGAGRERQPQVTVSKATTHAVTPPSESVKAERSPRAKPTPEVQPAETPVATTGEEAVTTKAVDVPPSAESAAKTPEAASKPEPQVIRNVTQLVVPDGSIVATQSTETRTEGTQASAQREVVVVEKVTVQALPEQAVRGVRYMAANGEHTMRIRLVPESLGEVRLEVIASKGEVSVKLSSASPAVREILQTHAQGLQTAIAQDNPGVVRVTVTPDVSNGAWLSGNAQRHSGQHEGGAQQRAGTPSSYHASKQDPPSASRRETAHAGNLNVYV
ncbi:MAG: flagellar hook-length control protein FliK [Candidatus Hydrogenedentes bacterium]|nr:flagellar hook-length control protein FliK [Candidatus Hydrogenedentota bacterium]